MGEFISGVIGALIGVISTLLLVKYNYRDLYARTVSSNRMDWINQFREEISIIAAALKSDTSNHSNRLFEAEKARTKLLTRLNMDTSNPGNEYNGVFAELLNQIEFKDYVTEQDNCTAERLIELFGKILEYEWKRVKKETGGEKR